MDHLLVSYGAWLSWALALMLAAGVILVVHVRSFRRTVGSAPPRVFLRDFGSPSRGTLGTRVTLRGTLAAADPSQRRLEDRPAVALAVIGRTGTVLGRSVPLVLRT